MNPANTTRAASWPGILEAYRPFFPIDDETPIVTLREGNTPLIPIPKIARDLGLNVDLFVKYDGLNPTGSFKDRGMTLAVSKAVESGARAVICASTGNTSAAAAAYAARCGIHAFVLVPDGNIALGKLSQALIYGATVLAVDGNFDDALRLVREISAAHPVTLVNSLNPYRLEGQKSGAFEICDVLGDAPDILAIPVGNAGNITAYWRGFNAFRDAGRSSSLPQMWGFQAAGSAPIVEDRVITNPETIATAIRIGNPASWSFATDARDASGGRIDKVTDDEITEAYAMLASREGVFCEPASAASLAGVIQAARNNTIPSHVRRIVCVLTGNGLKDPDRAIAVSPPPTSIPAELAPVEDLILPLLEKIQP